MCYTSDENCAKGRGVMRVLLVGNTGYITERFMEEAFPECQVLILGDAQVRTNRKKGIVDTGRFRKRRQSLVICF